MPSDNARHCVKMLVYKKVYRYVLHIQNKGKGVGIYFSERKQLIQ